MASDDLLSVAQVAAEFNVTAQTIRAWIRDGKLRASRVGKSHHILRSDVYAMLKSTAVERRPPPAPDLWHAPTRELRLTRPARKSEPATMWPTPGEGGAAALVPRQRR